MNTKVIAIAALGTAGLLVSVQVLAHHSFAAEFDADKKLAMTGVVTKVEWTNPHVYFFIEVDADGGKFEEWAFENCKENAQLNACDFNILLGNETVVTQKSYPIILANINKNILLQQLDFYSVHLEQNGTILVSGVLSSDEKEITENFTQKGFKLIQIFTKENWLCIQFEK